MNLNNFLKVSLISLILVSPLSFAGSGTEKPMSMKKGQKIFFISPSDGAVVTDETPIVFGVSGMKVRPSWEVIKNTGHHHILINRGPIKKGKEIPANDQKVHFHYGTGAKKTTVKKLGLKPGKYKLTLQFADGSHVSYGKKMSATIHVTKK